MSEEFEQDSTPSSPFIPLAILLAALIIWSGYQVFAAYSQHAVYATQFKNAIPTLNAAQNWQGRYNAMMKDLVDSSAKDQYIAAIAKEAVQAGIQAGLIRVNQAPAGDASSSTNSTATPAAPDSK